MDEASVAEMGKAHVAQVVAAWSDEQVRAGAAPLGSAARSALAKAVFGEMFGLGPVQPLVDAGATAPVTDIEIIGCDPVLMMMADGTFAQHQPVFATDADMVAWLQRLASQLSGDSSAHTYTFTRTSPHLEVELPGRARLSAAYWVCPRPRAAIRLQAVKDVDLTALRAAGTIDPVLEHFLTAAVRAGLNIVVSGQGQGSGKTTLLRALLAALHPMTSVAVVESVPELYLDQHPERHRRVFSQTALPRAQNTGESRHAAITTAVALEKALRSNSERLVVGEARAPEELLAMFEAMQVGNGSMTTIHANSARDVVERLVGLAVRDVSVGEAYAYRQIAATIDLIIFLGVEIDPQTRRRTRYVREIVEPTRGEGGQVAITDVFVPGEDGRAVPRSFPSCMDRIVAAGFERAWFTPAAAWRQS
ncbi:MAG: Flp pilus assembly complex ATPase component TadA [Micrococcales bacterium]|nr:Flp pilus assembly complex ATPase component TadA [Micrococcales bacterium]